MARWRSIPQVLLAAMCTVVVAFSDSAPVAAASKVYVADRFDIRLGLDRDGSMVVTERVTFTFGKDSFTYVFRDLPTRRTDGISVLSAAMDGQPFERGKNARQYEVKREKDGVIRITWRFAPVSGSTHAFDLSYRVRGVVEQRSDADLLAWRALPARHEYAIGCSAIEVAPPPGVAPIDNPQAVWQTGELRPAGNVSRAERCGIAANATWVITVRFPPRSLTVSPPDWQQTAVRGRKWAPVFGLVAAVVLATGLMALFVYYNNHRPPSSPPEKSARRSTPPSDFPVALAGALARQGASPAWAQAMGTVFDLARRGILTIEETDKRFGQRQFHIVRIAEKADLRPHEQVVMNMLFTTRRGVRGAVNMGDLARSAQRLWRPFRKQVREELRSRGLMSADRERSISRLQIAGAVVVVAALAGLGGAAAMVNRFQGWPLLVPFALLVGGLGAFVLASTLSPLSDDGLRQAGLWKAFGAHLRDISHGRAGSLDPQRFPEYLPYAAAFGAALGWAKAIKKGGVSVAPAWIRPAMHAQDDAIGAVIAVLSTVRAAGGHVDGGASAAGAAVSGAAGGGASGAG
jgi:hypothetical protein